MLLIYTLLYALQKTGGMRAHYLPIVMENVTQEISRQQPSSTWVLIFLSTCEVLNVESLLL